MIDTIHMGYEIPYIKGFNYYNVISRLTDFNEQRTFAIGKLRNLRVIINECYIYIRGSISKYYYGNNVQNLTYVDFLDAINLLNTELGFKVNDFKVSRLDFGLNVMVDSSPTAYLSQFAEYPLLEKALDRKQSIRYQSTRKALACYGKLKDPKRGTNIPLDLVDKNILRMEHRLLKDAAKQLGIDKLNVEHLLEFRIFEAMKDIWAKSYNKVKKFNVPSAINWDEVRKPKDASELIISVMINNCENSQEIFKCLFNELKSRKSLNAPKSYTQVKQYLFHLMNLPNVTEESPLIKELDEKVEDLRINFN